MYNSTESFALINGCVILPTMSEVLACQREGGIQNLLQREF